jgi:hypothetical protein
MSLRISQQRAVIGTVGLLMYALSACASAKSAPRRPQSSAFTTPTLPVGSCGEPERDGSMSDAPQVQHADRDLNDDGLFETVISDRTLCDQAGNCYWNVFVQGNGCRRFAGTIAGARLQVDRSTTVAIPGVLAPVRAQWQLASGRFLLQQYEYQNGGYRPTDTVLCVQSKDNKMMCADSK